MKEAGFPSGPESGEMTNLAVEHAPVLATIQMDSLPCLPCGHCRADLALNVLTERLGVERVRGLSKELSTFEAVHRDDSLVGIGDLEIEIRHEDALGDLRRDRAQESELVLGATAVDRRADLARRELEHLQIVFVELVLVLVALQDDGADDQPLACQRDAHPDLALRTDEVHIASFDHRVAGRPVDEQRAVVPNDIGRQGAAGREGLVSTVVLLVDEVRERNGVGRAIVERDEEVLSVEHVTELRMDRFVELVEVFRRVCGGRDGVRDSLYVLSPSDIRDVEPRAERSGDGASGVPDERVLPCDGPRVALECPDLVLVAIRLLGGSRHEVGIDAPRLVAHLGRYECGEPVCADDLVLGSLEDLTAAPVDHAHAPLLVEGHEHGRGEMEVVLSAVPLGLGVAQRDDAGEVRGEHLRSGSEDGDVLVGDVVRREHTVEHEETVEPVLGRHRDHQD